MAKTEITVDVMNTEEAKRQGAMIGALVAVLGLLAEGYRPDLLRRYIAECTDLKQTGMIHKMEVSGLAWIKKTIGADLMYRLREMLAEQENPAGTDAESVMAASVTFIPAEDSDKKADTETEPDKTNGSKTQRKARKAKSGADDAG